MATRDYTTRYLSDVTQAIAGVDQLIAKLLQAEQVIDRVKAKLAKLGIGVDKNLKDASNAAGGFNRSLGNTEARAKAATRAVEALGNAATTAGVSMQGGTGHADAMTASFGQLLTAGLALKGIKVIFGEMGKAIKEAREHAEQMAGQSLGNRDKARQLASLMGESGPNDRVMSRVFGVGMASGMSFDESLHFLQEFEGSITAGKEKGHIREDQKRDVAIAVARSAVRMQMDPKTAGDLAGTIAADVDLNNQVGKDGKKLTAAEAMQSQMEAIAYGLNEGRGDISTLARGEVATAAKAIGAGRMRERSDVAAFVGVGSQAGAKSGASAGTFAGWMDRALNRATGPAADFLKKSGISDLQYDEDKLHKLKEVLDKARAESKDPKSFDPNKYLAEQGFGAEQDRAALVGYVEKLDVLDHRLAESRKLAKDPSVAAGRNAAFDREKSAQNRKAEARGQYAEFKAGISGEDLAIARKNAAARLEAMGLLNRADQKIANAFRGGFGAAEWAGLQSQDQKTIDDEARRQLEVAAANAGIDTKGLRYSDNTDKPGQLRIQDTIDALRAAGADPHAGAAGGLEAEAANADVDPKVRAAREAAKHMQPGAGVPAQQKAPGPGPARAAGVGAIPGLGAINALPGAGGPMAAADGGSDRVVAAIQAQTGELLRVLTASGDPFGAGPSRPSVAPRRA